MKTADSIKNVLIVGSGTLGLRIALQSAISGFEVRMYDRTITQLESAQRLQQKLLGKQVDRGLVPADAYNAILLRITTTDDLAHAAAEADFVSESITEDLNNKIKCWEELSDLVPTEAVLTTNTSYLLPSQMADHVVEPSRFCAFHFHDVFWANVVDIMPHPGTAPWVTDMLVDLGKKMDQTPVIVRSEHSGYLFNHMLISFLGAAGDLLANGVASIEDIDRSWMGNFKMRSGPFGILDEVGLDTAWHIIKARKDRPSQQFAALLRSYLDQGKLGVKSGAGFYNYPNAAFKSKDFVTRAANES
ncbi:MAG: 3-hydroxyacyl-CoA dehydrogenase NAD-binding domain-containing protein [Bacteroidota bacterium]